MQTSYNIPVPQFCSTLQTALFSLPVTCQRRVSIPIYAMLYASPAKASHAKKVGKVWSLVGWFQQAFSSILMRLSATCWTINTELIWLRDFYICWDMSLYSVVGNIQETHSNQMQLILVGSAICTSVHSASLSSGHSIKQQWKRCD